MEYREFRKEYTQHGLEERDVVADPFEQFRRWFDQAVAAGLIEPNAMTLATVAPDGMPAARVVLMKNFDERGFVFFSNYTSAKGIACDVNPYACLNFYWPELERQVRITGAVMRVTPEESDSYFASRPRESQLGAWASQQSHVIAGRAVLEERLRMYTEQFAGRVIERPPFWGGYRVTPVAMEFWQGRPNRLHDRLRYRRDEGGWHLERLSP